MKGEPALILLGNLYLHYSGNVVNISESNLAGTNINQSPGGPVTANEEPPKPTKVQIDNSDVREAEFGPNVDATVKKSFLWKVRMGEIQSFGGIPIKVWIGAGGVGIVGAIAWIIASVLTGRVLPLPR